MYALPMSFEKLKLVYAVLPSVKARQAQIAGRTPQ